MFSPEINANSLLEAFEQRVKLYPSTIPSCVQLGPKNASFTVVIGSAIHGNETGSIPAVISMIDDLSEDLESLNACYFFFLGNPDAIRAGVRFIERDLNRCFQCFTFLNILQPDPFPRKSKQICQWEESSILMDILKKVLGTIALWPVL